MPASSIQGKDSEKYWREARRAADEQYPGLEKKDKERYFATVMTIYKSMCKNKACSPKMESEKVESLSDMLSRLESKEGVE